MALIQTIPEGEASGDLKKLYDSAIGNLGYVPNYLKLFSLRPEVYEAWVGFISTIRKPLRLRQYELITIAAVTALHCKY